MKLNRLGITMAALAVMGLMSIGCGDGGGSSSGGGEPLPSEPEKSLAQSGEGATGALDEATKIATEALINDGSGGAVTKASAPAGASSSSVAVIAYSESVALLIDLDAVDGNGNDLHPNASGVMLLAATGTVVGDPTAGQVEYAAVITASTDLVFTDPANSCTATISAGATFAHTVKIVWSWTDSENWVISAENNAAIVDFVLTVTDGVETWTATADCARTGTCTIAANAGQITLACAAYGAKFVTLSDGTVTHWVAVDVAGIGAITITVDGAAYGPWAAARVRAVWGISVL